MGVLGKPIDAAADGENNPVICDIAFPLRGDLLAAVEALRREYGDRLRLLPMSGTSSGGGIFQHAAGPDECVVGLRFEPPIEARIRVGSLPAVTAIMPDEIIIDPKAAKTSAGAAVTLAQLNQALASELGPEFRVAGADLTSYQYAAVGATFMTGGMGPQRRYFSDSVDSAAIFDGRSLGRVDGAALTGYAGTYGWSGIVSAVCCRHYRFPANEIAFVLPVSHEPEQLAGLLNHLAPYCFLDFDNSEVASHRGRGDLILGLEHISRAAMQPLLRDSSDGAMRARAAGLEQKCALAKADGLVFVSGLSQRAADEFLADLMDDSPGDAYTLAGIDLEHSEIFNDGEEMRALREAVPYAARMQQPPGKLIYKNHSDANIRIAPPSVDHIMRQLWQINNRYIDAVGRHFAAHPTVNGEILVYGHLNPFGVDPHNRVTLCSDDHSAYEHSRAFLLEARADYYRRLAALCAGGGATFIGGEKTADSELAIYQALGGPARAPADLRRRFARQAAQVRSADPLFNWRAPPPYVE